MQFSYLKQWVLLGGIIKDATLLEPLQQRLGHYLQAFEIMRIECTKRW